MYRDVAGHEDLTDTIIECGIKVHETFGPAAGSGGLQVAEARCVLLPDIVVNDLVIIELKAVKKLKAIHTAQLLPYLKLTWIPIGLLMNFNVPLLSRGVRRVVRPDLYRP